MTESLLENLKSYKPFDEVEAADVSSFIQFLELFKEKAFLRENPVGHVCPTVFVVNKERTKTLMAYHLTYDVFAWLGGHADGNQDSLFVAKKELEEETGLAQSDVKVLNEGKIFDISILPVLSHIKRGKQVSCHIHFNPTFVFEADETAKVRIKEDENGAIKWIPFKDIQSTVKGDVAWPLYKRILEKLAC